MVLIFGLGHVGKDLESARIAEMIQKKAEVLYVDAPTAPATLYNPPPIKPIVWENISVSRHSKGKSHKNKKLNHY